LASSLATLELANASDRRARKLFVSSLQAPNDNALAQAEWASDRVKIAGLDERLSNAPESYEAHALDAAAGGSLQQAVNSTLLWLADQPYSVEAAIFGSYQASKATQFHTAAHFAERGLIANPHHPVLLNNLAFAYAKQSRITEAQHAIDDLDRHHRAEDLSKRQRLFTTATRGLIALRQGDLENGTLLYLEVIDHAEDATTVAIALIMLVFEQARLAETADTQLLRRAADSSRRAGGEASGWLAHLAGLHESESTSRA
jgi:hypothetical protein